MPNPVQQAILARRSVRRYQEEQIREEELQTILDAGRHAPSGGNSQTGHFLVIQKPEILREMRDLVEGELAKLEVDDSTYKSLRTAVLACRKGGYQFMYQAPTLILVANRKGYMNAMADSAAALENMMIAAVPLGLGTCWINHFRWLNENPRAVEYLQSLGLRENEIVCGGVAVGYAADPPAKPLERTGNAVTYIR